MPQARPQFVAPATNMTSGFTRFNPSTSIYAPPNYDPSRLYPYSSYNYNYVYGNGSPDVRKLFGLTAYKPAGVPQTATNP